MKKYIKVVILSVVIVFVLNSLLFSVLTVVQAPYYDEAPAKVDSIYELYASKKYNDILYAFADGFFRGGEEDIKEIENALKSVSATKLSKAKSYFIMLTLDKSDFVLMTRTTYQEHRKIVLETIVASNVLVYSENGNIYIVCVELTEYAYEKAYEEIAIYEVKNTELLKLLEEHKTPKNKGFQFVLPEWRDDILGFPKSFLGMLYVVSFVIEFIVVIVIVNKFCFKKQSGDGSKPLRKVKNQALF